MTVTATCRICYADTDIEVAEQDWDTFNSPNRPLIQDIFPYIMPEQRELLISGVCDKCWKSLWGGEDE